MRFCEIVESGLLAPLSEEPVLVPAVKDKATGRIYRGQPGTHHHDIARKHGFFGVGWKDDPNYELGFVNHKGHFLGRDRALDYALQHDLMHDAAKRYLGGGEAPRELGASFLRSGEKES